MTSGIERTIAAIWRIESSGIIGGLVRLTRDVGLAEDFAQEALLAALEHWPTRGVPDNPGAWLMTTAKHRALDGLRRQKMIAHKHEMLAHETRDSASDANEDVLSLMLIACHPVLSSEARVALTLRLLGGLDIDDIARAFLTTSAAIAQRIVRAKRTLGEARVPFEMPTGEALSLRVGSVLEVIYLIFNEGYVATRGDDWMRLDLCEDALRLGRMLCELTPTIAEVHGLVALMEIHASRFRARLDARGEPVLLLDQDRGRWDQLLIHRGLERLARAEALAARSDHTRCKRRSPLVTGGRAQPARPTGRASWRSMMRWWR